MAAQMRMYLLVAGLWPVSQVLAALRVQPFGIIGVMATRVERNWTANIVVSSEHAGLRPYFKDFEAEVYRVLARVDDPRDVREYIAALRRTSEAWLKVNEPNLHEK